MSAKQFSHVVFIGRFQPIHLGHIHIIRKALDISDNVIIVCGSAYQPRTIKNPFTVQERWNMILNTLSDIERGRIILTFSYDYMYNDQRWAEEIQQRVKAFIYDPKAKIGIIGCKKDQSSYYLDMFPQWCLITTNTITNVANTKMLNATDVRINLFENKDHTIIRDLLNNTTLSELIKFKETPEFKLLQKEYDYVQKYKQAWAKAPYAPTFVTVDAVVIQSGHVLMVRRKAMPGEGNLALPGGFINQSETTLDAMLRELREETKLKVPAPVLKGSIKANKLFDHPDRSLRGRTITDAYLIELPNGELHPVKGGDDAAKAMWIPIADINELRDQIFEDHADIISYFLGRV
jgi:bifunctional NMN adenylyltransferase/nudix hydrolase